MIPLNNNVIVKRNTVEETSPGGIVIPTSGQEKPTTGTVVASATDELVVGDIVVFGKFAGKELKIGSEEVLIVPLKEILLKL